MSEEPRKLICFCEPQPTCWHGKKLIAAELALGGKYAKHNKVLIHYACQPDFIQKHLDERLKEKESDTSKRTDTARPEPNPTVQGN